MTLRLLAASAAVASLACAAPAWAVEGNPISGVGVSVETSLPGLRINTSDCVPRGGKLVKHVNGQWYCDLPLAAAPTAAQNTACTAEHRFYVRHSDGKYYCDSIALQMGQPVVGRPAYAPAAAAPKPATTSSGSN